MIDDTEAVAPTAAPPAPDGPARSQRPRTIIATVLGILTVIVMAVTVVAVWARATVLRSEPVAELVGDAIAEPEVQAALAAYLADQVAASVDLDARLTELLPDSLDRFAVPIASGANAAVERALERVLATPQVHDAITTLVERAHRRAMQVLEGDGLADGVNVSGGEVSINLLPLIAQGLAALQSAGLLDDVVVPELSADGDPDEQAATLSAALGRDLPNDFGQLVVYRSDSVEQASASVQTAQRLLVLAERAMWLLVIASIVLVAATILVAARRWRATLVLALGMAAAMVLIRSTVREVVSGTSDLALAPGAKAATRAIVGGASTSLMRLAGVLLLIALVVVAAVVLRRRQWRTDLVLVTAVLLGAVTVAVIGLGLWGLLTGIVVGIAVPIAARWLLPNRPPSSAAAP
jgi:hypothetical protein